MWNTHFHSFIPNYIVLLILCILIFQPEDVTQLQTVIFNREQNNLNIDKIEIIVITEPDQPALIGDITVKACLHYGNRQFQSSIAFEWIPINTQFLMI